MIFPVNNIAVINHSTGIPYHNGKALDFGWASSHHQWVLAVDNGYILKIEKQNLGGNVIYLKLNTGMVCAYGHLEGIIVKKGQKVVKGEHLARMGASGKGVTAEHLHFEIHSKGSKIYGKADIDPIKFLQVDKGQKVLNSATNKKIKFLYAPDNQNFEIARSYRLLVEKTLRSSAELINNSMKVKDVKKNLKSNLTSKKPNDTAIFKLGTDVFVTELKEDNKRLWGKVENCYIVLRNQDGTNQCEKLKGI